MPSALIGPKISKPIADKAAMSAMILSIRVSPQFNQPHPRVDNVVIRRTLTDHQVCVSVISSILIVMMDHCARR